MNTSFRWLKDYVGMGYKGLNDSLRKGITDKGIINKKKCLNSELDRIPLSDKISNVYCCSGLRFDLLKIWFSKRINEVIMFPDFRSCYASSNSAPVDITYSIKLNANSRGRYIADIVNKSSENEFLFKSETCFKIIKVSKKWIELQEIDYEEHSIVLVHHWYNEDQDIQNSHKKKQ